MGGTRKQAFNLTTDLIWLVTRRGGEAWVGGEQLL